MKCKQCGEGIINKREDTIFCNGNCKQKHYKRKKKIKGRIVKLQRLIQSENEIIDHWKQVFNEEKQRVLSTIESFQKKLNKNKSILEKLIELKSLTKLEYYKYLIRKFERNPNHYSSELEICYYYGNSEKNQLVLGYRALSQDRIKDIYSTNEKLNDKVDYFKKALDKNRRTKLQSDAEYKIDKSENEIKEFDQELIELSEIDLERLPIIKSKKTSIIKSKRISSAQGFSGKEIANMKFDGIQIKGEIGRFLGTMERNKCAIALTGDSGAGKSYFSYELANAFICQKLSVGYFTLESGFNNKFKEFASNHSGNFLFKAFEEGKLQDVRTEANNFDCIIIDSFSKISDKAKDFEELRQDFPNTFFIIIFQKTTDGKIRGGSSILFNSTATIDIKIAQDGERLATMKKSRYDSENFIYSITEGKLIKDDKVPIK